MWWNSGCLFLNLEKDCVRIGWSLVDSVNRCNSVSTLSSLHSWHNICVFYSLASKCLEHFYVEVIVILSSLVILNPLSMCCPVLPRLIVQHCDCGLAKWFGQQEFAIPQNVLEIVYGQTICWIGTFYSPMLPAICTMKYFFIFYIKKVIFLTLFHESYSEVLEVSIVFWHFWFLFEGVFDEQLPSSHTSVPSLQLQLLLPSGAADRPGSGLPACLFQCRTVSNALLLTSVSTTD